MTGLAFVGAGIVAELYAQAIERGVAARFTGVFDPDRAAAARLATRLGRRAFASLEALLADGATDAVVVLSPTATHVDVATRCLQAGRHVLLEKPVAERTAEIAELARLPRAAGRVCMPAHNYIYHPQMERGKRLIAEGRLGTIASAWLLYNIFHEEAIAALRWVLREVAIHHAYTLLYLLGRPTRVLGAQPRVHYETLACEDQALVVCELPGGTLAQLWVSFAASDRSSQPWAVAYKVLGTRGSWQYTWSDALYDDAGGPAWGVPSYVESFEAELAFFVEQAIGAGHAPLSTRRPAGASRGAPNAGRGLHAEDATHARPSSHEKRAPRRARAAADSEAVQWLAQ